MTQEEKDLLLKDICARSPYVPIIRIEEHDWNGLHIDAYDTPFRAYYLEPFIIGEIEFKPYLRPISSMTEEEMDRLFDILHIDKDGNNEDWIKINDKLGIKFFFRTGKWVEDIAEAYDYLNSIHIDYRGLIPMGLALKAHDGMYKTQ